eukprot:GHVT01005096.1.p1 GENE.GHVT01005096.1~~GHVT01005096.1.p1  ORF type:complete len:716 (-),score=121.13 GHVT01005096.1:973-3120(-)
MPFFHVRISRPRPNMLFTIKHPTLPCLLRGRRIFALLVGLAVCFCTSNLFFHQIGFEVIATDLSTSGSVADYRRLRFDLPVVDYQRATPCGVALSGSRQLSNAAPNSRMLGVSPPVFNAPCFVADANDGKSCDGSRSTAPHTALSAEGRHLSAKLVPGPVVGSPDVVSEATAAISASRLCAASCVEKSAFRRLENTTLEAAPLGAAPPAAQEGKSVVADETPSVDSPVEQQAADPASNDVATAPNAEESSVSSSAGALDQAVVHGVEPTVSEHVHAEDSASAQPCKMEVPNLQPVPEYTIKPSPRLGATSSEYPDVLELDSNDATPVNPVANNSSSSAPVEGSTTTSTSPPPSPVTSDAKLTAEVNAPPQFATAKLPRTRAGGNRKKPAKPGKTSLAMQQKYRNRLILLAGVPVAGVLGLGVLLTRIYLLKKSEATAALSASESDDPEIVLAASPLAAASEPLSHPAPVADVPNDPLVLEFVVEKQKRWKEAVALLAEQKRAATTAHLKAIDRNLMCDPKYKPLLESKSRLANVHHVEDYYMDTKDFFHIDVEAKGPGINPNPVTSYDLNTYRNKLPKTTKKEVALFGCKLSDHGLLDFGAKGPPKPKADFVPRDYPTHSWNSHAQIRNDFASYGFVPTREVIEKKNFDPKVNPEVAKKRTQFLHETIEIIANRPKAAYQEFRDELKQMFGNDADDILKQVFDACMEEADTLKLA